MRSVYRANAIVMSILAMIGLVFGAMFLPGCQTVTKIAQSADCDKIAYYDSYVEAVRDWAKIVLPMLKIDLEKQELFDKSLALVDASMDRAKGLCDSYKGGKSSLELAKAALDAVYASILELNTVMGLIAPALSQGGP